VDFSSDLLAREPQARLNDLHSRAREKVQEAIVDLERQQRIVRHNPIFKGREFMIEDDLCFVLMPFDPTFLRLYEDHIKPSLTKMGFRVMKANDIFTSTEIIEDIWGFINKARLIVADVTNKNPNVFYELGMAQTVGKDLIILTQNKEDVPFDLRHLRYFAYVDNAEGWQTLKGNLEKAVHGTLHK
jgi:hypothetical protein